ncbi:MAG: alpha-amylase family glycosyl hydrolase [Candidatus Hydrogenedentota bacterium]
MYSQKKSVDSPEWIYNTVIYQLFVRAHTKKGDFKSVIPDLDRIKNLGATLIWFMPIHPIGIKNRKGTLGSPYSVKDYRKINFDLGNEADFLLVIQEIHKRGMRVIIDWVANHCSLDNETIFSDPDWLKRDENGNLTLPHPDWNDVVNLNYRNCDLRRYIIDSMKYWIKEFGIDGFRCDVASLVPTDFWVEARIELKKVKEDILLLAESNEPELHLASFDITYESEIRKEIRRVFKEGASADNIRKMYEEQKRRFPQKAIRLRFLENNDEDRSISFFGFKETFAAAILMYMLDGVPLIWSGQESGDEDYPNWRGLFDKLEINFNTAYTESLFSFYKKLFKIRKDNDVLRDGESEFLLNSHSDDVVTFLRFNKVNAILVGVNMRATKNKIDLGLRGRGIDILNGDKVNLSQGLSIDGYSGRIIKLFSFI